MEPAVAVRAARSRADYDVCVGLQREVWGLSDLEITSAIQLIATVHAGGLLLVAEAAGEGIVGFSYGFAAWSDGVPHLHSDMLAVLPTWRGRGVGRRLKWAQREAALARGLDLVTWTFDPMRAKNAGLNLRQLGAIAREFLQDLYGRTSSALHHGLATDRLLASWELGSPRVKRLAAGRGGPPPPPARAARINEVRLQGGLPVSSDPRLDLDARRLLLQIPSDWDAVCRGETGLAREWQGIVRRSFQACFVRGYAAVDFASIPEGSGVCYVLERLTAPSRRAAPGRKTTRSRTRRRASRAGRRGAARAGRGRR
jgi:predicted GNAT superfamily acetyltransferase